MSKLSSNLTKVLERINSAALKRPNDLNYFKPRLVAVSKLKPISDIIELYNSGQIHFGENYITELEEKSTSVEILKNCPKIKWHFIGNLQSNKIAKLAKLPNLFMVETIDSLDLAVKLDRAWTKYRKTDDGQLRIMIQVNTSGEDQKNGISPTLVLDLYRDIKEKCQHLNLVGLMTIGSFDTSINQNEPNKDFKNLIECKQNLAKKLGIQASSIDLSMGMSHDFEQAIIMGSHSVRVGTLIFGERIKT